MLKGDRGAFDSFVNEFYPRLYRFAFTRVGRDPETTQDVVQGTFEKVFPKLSYYRGEASLFSWLCSICRCEIASFWKLKKKREPEVELIRDAPEVRAAVESLALAESSPELEVHRKEVSHLISMTLESLPMRYGSALRMKYLEGLSVRDVANRLRLTNKAAESLLTRARKAFRDEFVGLIGGGV
jgi:RNA polymerase sigma-70 factor (ECF subfamily)